MTRKKKQDRCEACGCTDAQACPGGCHWVRPGMCSACALGTGAPWHQAPIRTRFTLQTDYAPEGFKGPEPISTVGFKRWGVLPFVPSAGMHIDSGDGELRPVKRVFFACDEPGYIEVEFENCDRNFYYKHLVSHGWVVE